MFNSRNPAYRNPTGAVSNQTNIHFKIKLPRSVKCSAATLCVKNDETAQTQKLSMYWCGENEDQTEEWWECDYVPEKIGLYFYYFEIQTENGSLKLQRKKGGEGSFNGSALWQLTVYQRDFQTPNWLSGGVMYQIFPDRFYNSGEKKKEVPYDRKIHEKWGQQPDWRPNEKGEVTNSDYFGGDLKGITQKLPYLQSLGVTCIYLNPIFEAHSNHRYDTADYSKIDPLLGDEQDFRELCEKAKEFGMRVMLDGVFNHTGCDSVYFNRKGRYGENHGAYRSKNSPYYPWYSFLNWPNEYESWWGFYTLPNVAKDNPQYREYINGKDGIIQKWLEAGASGWRLDVADELPDAFIEELTASAKEKKKDAVVLGEIWEDASNKIAYGVRRKYLWGKELDSVMNYPFREAILGFLTGQNADEMMEHILSILENYPPQVIHNLMNHIGTHDTERALTVLDGEPLNCRNREWQSKTFMTAEEREKGLKLLRLAALMQYTLPGVPCIYYGDEAGMEGYRDPFNRGCYPWGREDEKMIEWYRKLGQMRKNSTCLKQGEFRSIFAKNRYIAYERRDKNESFLVAINAGDETIKIDLPNEWQNSQSIVGAKLCGRELELISLGCTVLKLQNKN